MTFSPEVRGQIDAHLDAVERQLQAAGVERPRRRGIVDELEAQISDMVAASPTPVETVGDINPILARLDPPDAYRGEAFAALALPIAGVEPTVIPQFCPEARRGAIWWTLGIAALAILAIGFSRQTVVQLPGGQPPPRRSTGSSINWMALMPILVGLAIMGPLMGTMLGWKAISVIRNSAGRLSGMALAVIDASVIPVLLLFLLATALWYLIVMAYYEAEVSPRGRAIFCLGTIVTGVLFSAFYFKLLIRIIRSPRPVT